MTNLIRGSKILNGLKMVRGYSPSIFFIPVERIPVDMIYDNIKIEPTRAIEQVMKAKSPTMMDPDLLRPGKNVLI